jgi:threonine/homoserine/homoserine lactone efflux protein
MPNPALLLAFLAAAALLTITPGVDTAIVLRTTAIEGRRSAARAALGIALGCLAWGAAVSLGLGAVLRASTLAYTVIKLAGATYLLWLGVRLLARPRRAVSLAGDPARLAPGLPDAFWRGLLTNLLNPKVGVFYVTFLPQFVPTGASVAAWTFALACIHVLLGLAWFAGLIAATAQLGTALQKPAVLATLDRLGGAVFVGFGVKLALSSAR